MQIKTKDIINFKALSTALTGSPRRINKENTADKYADDVQELVDLIDHWLKWKKYKHSK